LFPTYMRGTAMGFVTAMNRIAATVGTFIFPTIMANYGLKATLYSCGAVFFIGFLLCIMMAPETKNMNLAEAASLNRSKAG
ncbi:MAG: MFS transporter, partial [Sporomusa sp.]